MGLSGHATLLFASMQYRHSDDVIALIADDDVVVGQFAVVDVARLGEIDGQGVGFRVESDLHGLLWRLTDGGDRYGCRLRP